MNDSNLIFQVCRTSDDFESAEDGDRAILEGAHEFCQSLKGKDFIMKGEWTTRKRWGKREYLNSIKTNELEIGLDEMFEGMVEVTRIKHGRRQTLETLINEEVLLLAKYLRGERKTWVPRIACAREFNYQNLWS